MQRDDPVRDAPTVETERPDLLDLIDDLDELAADIESSHAAAEIQEAKQLLAAVSERGLIDTGARRLDPGDAAEAFVGSVIFASPLLVEDGVFDIANYLFGFTVAGVPVFLIANTLFVFLMTYALIEWTGRAETDTHVLFGVVPLRVVMVLGISFVVAAILMTVWGRVGDWRPPVEAIARINVLWTVGSLGAALGDILSNERELPPEHEPARVTSTALTSERVQGREDEPSRELLVVALREQLDELESVADSDRTRQELQQIRARVERATAGAQFGDRIRKYTSRDIAEAFVGSIFFSIPFLVEDGVFDVANYFLSFRVGQFPVFFLLNAAFVLFMISSLVYWTGPQDVRTARPLFGIVPRRLVGIALVSFLTTAGLMTMWGRVDNWQAPVVAIARISVVWTVASFGAALGDILPGESSGDDIYDDLAEIGELLEEGDGNETR